MTLEAFVESFFCQLNFVDAIWLYYSETWVKTIDQFCESAISGSDYDYTLLSFSIRFTLRKMEKSPEFIFARIINYISALNIMIIWNTLFFRCDNESSCSIGANKVDFNGDPCPGTKKYLEVHYECHVGMVRGTNNTNT